jgi:hypothetical protein
MRSCRGAGEKVASRRTRVVDMSESKGSSCYMIERVDRGYTEGRGRFNLRSP